MRNYLVAGLVASSLCACGGGSGSTPTTQTTMPKISVPVLAPAHASAPVADTPPAAPASSPVASTPTPASAPAAPLPPKTVLIEIHGDDAMLGITSESNGMPTVTQQSEPVDSQALLRAQFGDGVTISNLAEGGAASTLVNMMAGMDGGGPPFAQRMATSKADIELVNSAINDDLAQSLGPYTDALIAWVQDVRAAGKVPVLEEPNPVCDNNHPNLVNYVTMIDNVAQAYSVPLVTQYAYLQTVPNYCSHLSAGLYPDDAIYAIKAQREAAVLASLVSQIEQ